MSTFVDFACRRWSGMWGERTQPKQEHLQNFGGAVTVVDSIVL